MVIFCPTVYLYQEPFATEVERDGYQMYYPLDEEFWYDASNYDSEWI